MADENPFNIKLGKIFSPNGTGRFVSFAGRVRRAANTASKSSSHSSSRSKTTGEQFFSRRVIVKVHLVKMGGQGYATQKLHVDYIQRDSAAREGDKGSLFSRDEIMADGDAFTERGKDDRHQFRIIVSPEDGKEIGDLRTFTRNFMAEMERDLGTRLDWVAANHYDTANPHSHVVLRGVKDDGKNLVIPRQYISHSMRELGEELATRELGPISQIDVAMKLAKQVNHERYTALDKALLSKAVNQVVDVNAKLSEGMNWQQRFEKGRVKALAKMGLAEKVGFGKWRLDDSLERTLRRMGERGDILRTYQRAMTAAKVDRPEIHEPIYDPQAKGARPITGRVLKTGIFDDVNDRSYIVLDTLQGEALFVETGAQVNIEEIKPRMIVTAGPQSYSPKQSDYTIAEIASKRGGVYSPSAHEMSDPSAREEFIQAHVRRLEALRRAGHAERHPDGSWQIPKDYLRRAADYEKKRGYSNPVKLDIRSQMPLKDLPKTIGATWVDEMLVSGDNLQTGSGFGEEVDTAKARRLEFLRAQGLITKAKGVNADTLQTLERLDLESAGQNLESEYEKPYKAAPRSGKLSGVFRESIQRPSGKYAVIEKSKEFTLVPWRETLERNRGKSVSGIVKGQTISWTLTKGRGIS